MATTPIYFQWQNDILLKTIYPLREMKLRDFLVFFEEIDLWAAYKGKSLETMQDEVTAFKSAQAKHWAEAYDSAQEYREFFITGDMTGEYRKKYADPDLELLKKINLMHTTFKNYFPRIKNVVNERYFLTQRIYEWETSRKWAAGGCPRTK